MKRKSFKKNKPQLKILGRNVPVVLLNQTEIDKLAKDKDILGFFCSKSQTIYINSGLKGIRYKEVLYHEMMHATLCFAGVSQLLTNKIEEAICNAVEAWAYTNE